MKLSTRVVFTMVGLATFSVALVSYVSIARIEAAVLPARLATMQLRTKELADDVAEALATYSSHLMFVRRAPALQDFVALLSGEGEQSGPNEDFVRRSYFTRLMLALMEAKPEYKSIRLVEATETATSTIRIVQTDAPSKNIRVVPDIPLSDVQRQFVQETLAAPDGATCISKVEWLPSFDTADPGPIPMLWAATPLTSNSGRRFGLIEVGVDLTDFFNEIKQAGLNNERFFLTDDRGNYLAHHDKRIDDQIVIGSPRGINDDVPELAVALNSATYVLNVDAPVATTYTSARIPVDHGRSMFLFHYVPSEKLVQSVAQVRRAAMIGGGVALLVAMILSAWITRSLTGPLDRMIRAVNSFDTANPVPPPVQEQGEMGVLARALARMGSEVRARHVAEEKFRLAVEASPSGIVMTNSVGRIVLVNAETLRMFQYERDELLGQTIEALVPERFRRIHTGHRGTYHAKPERRSMGLGRDLYGLRKDGKEFPVEIGLNPITTSDGVYVMSSIADITERRNLAEQLRQAQKMEAVGRLAGGIAHDFNNLLSVIIGCSEMIQSGDCEPHEIPTFVQEVIDAGKRAAGLTSQLLAFSRRSIFAAEPMDLNSLLADLERLLRRLIGEDVELAFSSDPSLLPVRVDRSRIEQVFMNLAINSRDAMPNGGRLAIETKQQTLIGPIAETHGSLKPGPYAVISVTDNGTGMTEDVKAHIFEPFFTTKERGKGTGLGLATVYGIIKQSGGSIMCYSELGMGTTFRIYIPSIEAESIVESEGHEAAREMPRATETVLLAEDEEGLRRLAKRVLEGKGYKVIEAKNGKQAIEAAAEYDGQIHLLISDVVMPEMGGHPLAQAMRETRPDIRVLFMSGFTDDSMIRQGVLMEQVVLLQKPFTPTALLAKVREVLSVTKSDKENSEPPPATPPVE